MPTIPLYTPAAKPLASHHVTSPGGYEWWQFSVTPPAGQRTTIDIFDGDPFNKDYRRAYARYRRAPTRNVPPQPAQYPLTRIALQRVVEAKSLPEGFRPAELLQSNGTVVLECSLAGRFRISLCFAPQGAWDFQPTADVISPQCDVQGKIVLSDSDETVKLDGVGVIKQLFTAGPITDHHASMNPRLRE